MDDRGSISSGKKDFLSLPPLLYGQI